MSILRTMGEKTDPSDTPLIGEPRQAAPGRSRGKAAVCAIANFCIFALISVQLLEILSSTYQRYQGRTTQSLDQELYSHCKSLLVPPEGYYTSRLARLSKALSIPHSPIVSGKSATWITEPGPSAEYVLGAFGKGDWWLSERPFLIAITPDGNDTTVTLLTPEFERLRAQGIRLPAEVNERVTWVAWREDENPYAVLVDSLKGRTDVVLMDDMVRSFVVAGVRDAMRDAAEMSSTDQLSSGEGSAIDDSAASPMTRLQEAVWSLRERKDEREIGLLRCANQFTLHAIRNTRSRMHIGISESKTSAILEEEMAKTGLIGGEGLVLFGEDAALPHGTGTDRKLGKEDLILIDAGGKWGGYVSDITRTFALPQSRIPRLHREVWEVVRKAQYAPYLFLQNQTAARPPKLNELDNAARQVVSKYTSPESSGTSGTSTDFSFFTHRLGHGIGLEGHERPYLVPGPVGEQRVKSGNVFSLEPGIYVPWQEERSGNIRQLNGVGVRLEDCFVVSENTNGQLGGEWLTGPVEQWGRI